MNAYEQIKEFRSLYLASGKAPEHPLLRPEISKAWLRSFDKGVDSQMKCLPSPQTELADQLYQSKFGIRRHTTQHELQKFSAYLDSINSVLFSLNTDFLVVSKYGNQALLDTLAKKNITVGSMLSEYVIGVTGVSLAALKNSPQYVCGWEHYAEILCPYATIGCPIQRSDDYSPGYYFMILPANSFHPAQLHLLDQLAQLLKLTWTANRLQLTDHHLQSYFKQNEIGYILADTQGGVFQVNSYLIELGLCQQKPQYQPLTSLFPELSVAMDCLNGNKHITDMEITFRRPKLDVRTFFMNCRFMPNIGLSIMLRSKQKVHRTVNRIANYTAYYTKEHLIGSSQVFSEARALIDMAARRSNTVLITGESGTGKELFAQAIHNASDRENGPFISINCAAIPRELISSELFGYESGAFTGARKDGAVGKIELADQGTLFLDEIAEMPMDMQTVLLRVLEERKVQRLGGKYPIPVDIKIITATNKNLLEAIDRQEFRLDLYYRLNILHIEIPPLRNRKEDVRELVYFFLNQFKSSEDEYPIDFHPLALQMMDAYHWPGNVRELRNTVERCCIICSSKLITADFLPKNLIDSLGQNKSENLSKVSSSSVHGFVYRQNEHRRIMELMEKYNGNKAKVARELGIARATLYKRLRQIDEDSFPHLT